MQVTEFLSSDPPLIVFDCSSFKLKRKLWNHQTQFPRFWGHFFKLLVLFESEVQSEDDGFYLFYFFYVCNDIKEKSPHIWDTWTSNQLVFCRLTYQFVCFRWPIRSNLYPLSRCFRAQMREMTTSLTRKLSLQTKGDVSAASSHMSTQCVEDECWWLKEKEKLERCDSAATSQLLRKINKIPLSLVTLELNLICFKAVIHEHLFSGKIPHLINNEHPYLSLNLTFQSLAELSVQWFMSQVFTFTLWWRTWLWISKLTKNEGIVDAGEAGNHSIGQDVAPRTGCVRAFIPSHLWRRLRSRPCPHCHDAEASGGIFLHF